MSSGREDIEGLILGPEGGGGKSLQHLVHVRPFPSEKGYVYGSYSADVGQEGRSFPLLGSDARECPKLPSVPPDPPQRDILVSLKLKQTFAFRRPAAAGPAGPSSILVPQDPASAGQLGSPGILILGVLDGRPPGPDSLCPLDARVSEPEGPAETSPSPLYVSGT